MPFVPSTRSGAAYAALAALAFFFAPLESRADARPPQPAVRNVGEVNVTATRAERDVLEVPGNVTVLDREQIERSGARHVAELLRREAGLFVTNTTTNPEGYTVEARGFNNGGGNGSSLLVLVDGRRVNEPTLSTPDWALMRLDYVERVEIVRGPTSAVYGDNAIGGVVHILTRRGQGAGQLTLSGRSGSFDADGGSLFAGASAGPVEATLFADMFRQEGFRERSDFRTRSTDGKLRFSFSERLAAELAAGYSSDNRKRPGTLTAAQIETEGRDAVDPSDDKNENNVRARYLQGLLEFALQDDLIVKLQPFYRTRDEEAGIADPSSLFNTDTEVEAKGLNLQMQLDRSLAARRNRLLVGADWLEEEVENESLFFFPGGPPMGSPSDTRARRRIYGLFLQEEWNLSRNLLLSTGVRFDHARYNGRDRLAGASFRNTFDLWSPKAALTYRIAEPASLYVSFSRGFRFPNFDEALGFFGFTPGLKPERSKSYEVGLTLRSERAKANLAVYRMDVTDEILFNSEFGLFGQNVNFDRIRHRGVELSLSFHPLAFLELYGSYTFDDTRIRRDALTDLDSERVPITPRHRGTYGVRLTLPFGFEAGLNANLVGSRGIASDLENEFEKLPKYARYDAVLRFRPPLGTRVEPVLSFAVRNVFDREYNDFAGERTFVPGLVAFNPAPDRNYEAAITLTVRR